MLEDFSSMVTSGWKKKTSSLSSFVSNPFNLQKEPAHLSSRSNLICPSLQLGLNFLFPRLPSRFHPFAHRPSKIAFAKQILYLRFMGGESCLQLHIDSEKNCKNTVILGCLKIICQHLRVLSLRHKEKYFQISKLLFKLNGLSCKYNPWNISEIIPELFQAKIHIKPFSSWLFSRKGLIWVSLILEILSSFFSGFSLLSGCRL